MIKIRLRWPSWLLLGVVGLGCQNGSEPTTPKKEEALVSPPQAVFQKTSIDAGEVELGKSRRFTFLVSNTGGQPLELTLTKRSCSCAEVTLPKQPIPPGQKDEIALLWTPIPGISGRYALSSDIQTNDPRHPTVRLDVYGHINPVLRTYPENWSIIDFGDNALAPGEVAQRELKIYSNRLPSFGLEATTTHPGLVITKSPLAAGDSIDGRPITSGYLITIKTSDKLPMGLVQENLILKAQLPGEESPRTLMIPVYAQVANGIFRVAPQVIEFKKRKITEEDRVPVQIRFTVPSQKESIQVVRVEPSFLQVDKPVRLGPGIWRSSVRIPKDHPEAAKYQADHFMEGRIIFKASGCDKEIPVRVKWNPPDDK